MIVMPIVYVSDVQRAQAFYELLGFSESATSRAGEWVELTGAGGILALHRDSSLGDPTPDG